jgi:hypothetical protein
MLRKTAIALAATGLFVAASPPTDALAFGRGGGGHFGGGFSHGGFGGVAHGFAGRGFVGPGFGHARHFGRFGVPLALGLGLGYGAYSYGDSCYAWTPYGYRWVCGYDYY